MIHGILAYHQVANVQIRTEGSRNAGVHQMGYAKAVAENLGTQGRADLAHAALHHGDRKPLQSTIKKAAAGPFGFPFFLHQAKQGFHFFFHGADDS